MTAEVEELRRIITEELRGSGCGDFPGYTIVAKHIAERLASALRSSRSVEGWRPVDDDTPKDVPFLAYWPDGYIAGSPFDGGTAAFWVTRWNGYDDDFRWCPDDGDLTHQSQPTHWMPLPASPKALKTGGE